LNPVRIRRMFAPGNFPVAFTAANMRLASASDAFGVFDKPLISNLKFQISKSHGGEGGIRTHGTVPRSQHFQCCQFNHSCTSPRGRISDCELRIAEFKKSAAKKPKTPQSEFRPPKDQSAIRNPKFFWRRGWDSNPRWA